MTFRQVNVHTSTIFDIGHRITKEMEIETSSIQCQTGNLFSIYRNRPQCSFAQIEIKWFSSLHISIDQQARRMRAVARTTYHLMCCRWSLCPRPIPYATRSWFRLCAESKAFNDAEKDRAWSQQKKEEEKTGEKMLFVSSAATMAATVWIIYVDMSCVFNIDDYFSFYVLIFRLVCSVYSTRGSCSMLCVCTHRNNRLSGKVLFDIENVCYNRQQQEKKPHDRKLDQ